MDLSSNKIKSKFRHQIKILETRTSVCPIWTKWFFSNFSGLKIFEVDFLKCAFLNLATLKCSTEANFWSTDFKFPTTNAEKYGEFNVNQYWKKFLDFLYSFSAVFQI